MTLLINIFAATQHIFCRISERFCRELQLGFNGGEGEIRTLDTLLEYAPLARECLRPLGHLSRQYFGVKHNPETLPSPYLQNCLTDPIIKS